MSVPYSDTSHQSPAEVLDGSSIRPPQKVVDVFPVVEWLRNLGLSKYEDVFVREEIDWDTLQCLTDEVTFFSPLLISTGGNACIGPNLEVVSVCWCAERNLIWLWLHPFDMGALMNSFGIYIFNYQSALQIFCKSGQNGISQVRTWYKSSAMKVEIC